jgi:hypothetical protein
MVQILAEMFEKMQENEKWTWSTFGGIETSGCQGRFLHQK